MDTIGARLKAERVRMGLSQDEFAGLAGVQRRAQGSYERDQRLPDAGYLAAIAQHGADVQLILTGRESGETARELQAYGDAWEVLDEVLQAAGRKSLSAQKKRQIAEALYHAVKSGSGELEALATLLVQAA